MRWNRAHLFVAAVLATVSGCGSQSGTAGGAARPEDPRAAIDAIVLCKTTEAELRQSFGEPTRDGRLHDARVMSWILESGDVVHYLAVMLATSGIVIDVYWDLPTEIPWSPTDQCQR